MTVTYDDSMKKILLINTSRFFLEEGKSVLDRKDFQVFMVSSTQEALMLHRKERVNLIVSELDMPEMGGDVLCSIIRGEPEIRTVSVILICQNTPADIARVSRCGANSWITKPFSANTLLEQVEKLLAISTRRSYRVLLRAKIRGVKEETLFFCTSENISVTGLLIETDRVLAKGDLISCSFYLPGSPHIVAEGEVVRSERSPDLKYRCGIRFLNLSEEFRIEVEKFVDANLNTNSVRLHDASHLTAL
jgi:DNA-binding response OmpR family regulator